MRIFGMLLAVFAFAIVKGGALADEPAAAGIIMLAPSAPGKDAPAFVLNSGDATNATVGDTTSDGTTLHIVFTEAKRAEFGRFTAANVSKKVKLIANGKVVGELTIGQPIRGPFMEVSLPSREAAEEAAKLLVQRPSAG